MASLVNPTKRLWKKIAILNKLFQSSEEEMPNSFYKASISLIPNQTNVLQENYRPISLTDTDAKFLIKH